MAIRSHRDAASPPLHRSRTVQAIAAFEAFKGVLVLAAASGLLLFLHQDLHRLAASLVAHTHLNPAARYPHIFLDAATHLQDRNLLLLAFGAGCYSALRFVEAYGLYRNAPWAEVLAALSGAVYVPFELAHLWREVSLLSLGALLVNLLVVAVMVASLLRRRRTQAGHCG